MATPPKELLTLIRDVASEKSQGVRRLVDLKKCVDEGVADLETAGAALQDVKGLIETTEQELRGYEVELALNDSSIQTLEARNALIQDEISTVGLNVEALKNEERTSRDEFISLMVEYNSKIREFQKEVARVFQEGCIETSSGEAGVLHGEKEVTEVASRALENEVKSTISQAKVEEQEFKAEQNINKQLKQVLDDAERKAAVVEAIVKETRELLNLTDSELEEACAKIGNELQKRCVCPSCHLDNVEALGGMFQANEET